MRKLLAEGLFRPLKVRSIFLLTIFLLTAIQSTVLARFSPDNGSITLPDGFRAQVIADDIGKARQIAIRENGDMYVSLMEPVDMNYVAAMRDTDGDGRMEFIKYFGELDSSCKGVGLYNGYLVCVFPNPGGSISYGGEQVTADQTIRSGRQRIPFPKGITRTRSSPSMTRGTSTSR